eukprot:SAG11_NODE_1415_length_4977_cov_6.362444_1_plen_106_part_00
MSDTERQRQLHDQQLERLSQLVSDDHRLRSYHAYLMSQRQGQHLNLIRDLYEQAANHPDGTYILTMDEIQTVFMDAHMSHLESKGKGNGKGKGKGKGRRRRGRRR